jgi:hypothetical protein
MPLLSLGTAGCYHRARSGAVALPARCVLSSQHAYSRLDSAMLLDMLAAINE